MTQPLAIGPAAPEAARGRLAALEAEIARADAALTQIKTDLQTLQTRYLREVGPLYAELVRIEDAIAEAEIAAGVRPARDEPGDDAADADADGQTAASCGNRAAPGDDLKRIFRRLARTIHPDLALDDPARYRRHSLMAEANRAYADRDADRLRLILRTWEADAGALPSDDAVDEGRRIEQRIAALEARRLAIDVDLADLRGSAIGRLKTKIDEARAKGWDLFAEMIAEVRRDIRRASARLAALRLR